MTAYFCTPELFWYTDKHADRVGGEPKRRANLDKHGLDFADLIHFDWETALVTRTHSARFKAIGRYADGAAVVIYAELGTEAISIISFRPANARERRLI